MAEAHSFYDRNSLKEGLTWEFVRERIGSGLRECYEVPKELPTKLLTLVRKLNTMEGPDQEAAE
jgi:hypothetical protein